MSTLTAKHVARFVAAVGVVTLSFGAVHASDRSEADGARAVVNYTDLDLSKAADVRSLYARLQRASARVCGDHKDSRSLAVKRAYDACYQESLARAVDAVNHSAVTAMFNAEHRIKVAGRGAKVSANT